MKNNLILLHGALGNKSQLDELKRSLKLQFNVFSFDFEGHSKDSNSDKGFSIALFTENVIEFMSDNNLNKASFFGYSMGGYVALNLALTHPPLVDKIITFATKFNWTPESAEKEIKRLNPELIAEKVPAFAQMLVNRFGHEHWKEVVIKTADMMLKMGAGQKLNDEDYKNIPNPVLISIGTYDQMVTVQESEEVSRFLPNSSFELLEEFEHPIEKADITKLGTVVSSFMSRT